MGAVGPPAGTAPETAPIVRWIFAQRLAGHSLARITRALNDASIPCPSAADPGRNTHRAGLPLTRRPGGVQAYKIIIAPGERQHELAEAVRILGERADEVLHGPRATLGPPWSKDHRMALAATIVLT